MQLIPNVRRTGGQCESEGGWVAVSAILQDDFLARVTELAGPEAVDCGHVRIGNDLTPSLECFETQLAGAHPFRVAVETYGLENVLVFAVVRSTSGRLTYVAYDPDACNGNCWFERSRIWEGDCPEPQVVKDSDGSFVRDPVECFSPR